MPTDAEATIAELARQVLSGDLPMLWAVRKIVALRFDVDNPDDDAFVALRGYVSETDEFPDLTARALYSPEVLQKLDQELRDYDALAQDIVFRSCVELVARYGV